MLSLNELRGISKLLKPKKKNNLKNLIGEYLVDESVKRSKRGVLNFIGDVSKILFGTSTQSDAGKYNQHISALEKEQKEFLHISKEQMTIIKSTIGSVNLNTKDKRE